MSLTCSFTGIKLRKNHDIRKKNMDYFIGFQIIIGAKIKRNIFEKTPHDFIRP
jgi:hypothetical protein